MCIPCVMCGACMGLQEGDPAQHEHVRNAAFKLQNPISAAPPATRSFHTMQERGQSQQQVTPSMRSIASARLDPSAWLSSAAMIHV